MFHSSVTLLSDAEVSSSSNSIGSRPGDSSSSSDGINSEREREREIPL